MGRKKNKINWIHVLFFFFIALIPMFFIVDYVFAKKIVFTGTVIHINYGEKAVNLLPYSSIPKEDTSYTHPKNEKYSILVVIDNNQVIEVNSDIKKILTTGLNKKITCYQKQGLFTNWAYESYTNN